VIGLGLVGALALAAAPAIESGSIPAAVPVVASAAAATPAIAAPTPAAPAAAAPAPAAPAATDKPAVPADATPRAPAQGPDLELHVPKAEVKKVSLDVENLQARLDLDTKVANLLQINAGVVATVQKLKLELEGVQAETHLLVRLDRVAEVLEHALGTLDRNPGMAATPTPQASVTAAGSQAAAEPVPRTEQATAQVALPQPLQHQE
jgi:hypothetical protein